MTPGPDQTPGPTGGFDVRELPVLIERPEFLARVGRAELLAAMAECWPDGVPAGTLAEDIHHLDRLGVRPGAEQGAEWLAWLHLLLVSHGRSEDAAALVAAAPRLPWRTVWSRWVPPGARATCSAPGGRVTGLQLVERDGQQLVLAHEAFVLARMERMEPDDEEGFYEYAVDLRTGEPVAGPKLYRPYAHDEFPEEYVPLLPADLPRRGEGATNGPDGWEGGAKALPVCHEQVGQAVRTGALAVLGGGWGYYAVEIDEAAAVLDDAATPVWPMPAEDDVTTRVAAAELPGAARTVTRGWLADRFGADRLWSADPAELPDGLEHGPTRRFLTEVGLPAVRIPLLDLSGEVLAQEGLGELRTEDFRDADEDGDDRGEFCYLIAKDLERLIVVDGATGRVGLYDPDRYEGDYDSGPVASSVEQFAALLRLYASFYYGATAAELADAERALRVWAEELDPVTASSTFWQEVFQDREDFE
ncbi:SUKH-4 family immunity protein [Kitasatospora sp. NPDC093679]|uniref:SUKH-4 family immunity protein n=1 Tax=Kitasatospora sp. NPDC093679 TaxID=3154983 RepID=UPI00341AB899